MNTNHGPFPQEASCLPSWVRFALLQDEEFGRGWRRSRAGEKECQAGVAAWLAHGTAINQWLLKHLI